MVECETYLKQLAKDLEWQLQNGFRPMLSSYELSQGGSKMNGNLKNMTTESTCNCMNCMVSIIPTPIGNHLYTARSFQFNIHIMDASFTEI